VAWAALPMWVEFFLNVDGPISCRLDAEGLATIGLAGGGGLFSNPSAEYKYAFAEKMGT